MPTSRPLLLLILLLVIAAAGCGPSADSGSDRAAGPEATPAAAQTISGRIENGLRVLTFDPAAAGQSFRIYRGDYVLPESADGRPFRLVIPSLMLDAEFPAPAGQKAYFKVPEAGRFEFTMGAASGVIEAVELQAASYREASAAQAAEFIADQSPVLVDVRTPGEFAEGHLEGAVLIPVQEFQRRIGELSAHRDDPILVYCRTGNRSTVAAKLMIDAGFTQVVNLRRGIVDWARQGLPVVK